jgi:hypothetical protein
VRKQLPGCGAGPRTLPASRSEGQVVYRRGAMTLSVTWIGSSNKAVGRAGQRPEAVVIHIMEGTLAGTDSWFNAPESKVSAH